MNIDLLVKLSQIITPLILAIAGYLISRNLNQQANTIRLSSSFNSKWADVLTEKCVEFSNLVMEIMIGLQRLSEEEHPSIKEQKVINVLVNDLRKAEYDIQIHVELVDGSENIRITATDIFSSLGDILKNKHGSVDNIKALQSKLNKQLRDLHKKTLGL